MTRRTEFEPTSMTAACRDSGRLSPRGHMIDRARHVLHLLPSTRKAGGGHEILVRGKGARMIPGGISRAMAVGIERPALGLLLQVGGHDLLRHLLADGGVLARRQGFEA